MKRILFLYGLIFLLTLSVLNGWAQQDPLFTQYMNNPGLINPAYAGSKGILNMNGIFRKQWVGQEWSPTTTTLTVNSPLRKYEVGLGLTFVDDQIGPMHQTGLYIDYARHFLIGKKHNVSLGLKAGFNYFDINLMNLIMYEYDPYLAADPHNTAFLPNFGVGIYYFTDSYFVGISVPKLIRNNIRDQDNTLVVVGREERHYFLTAGYLFTIDDPVWKLKASTMTRLVNGAPVSLEIGLTAIFYERIWFGLTYRFGDAFAAHARVQVSDRLQLGYSYDMNNSRLKAYNSGSHEVFLSYDFSFKGQRIRSPRYF
ncbi:MAG TPA: type IX secretion system membrane protein PorP/SprF [Prolixibacteraceae bacterium]|nr:type IX secretion system membrane protein PorP/SprF [Prolixibacteraceae bacterium]